MMKTLKKIICLITALALLMTVPVASSIVSADNPTTPNFTVVAEQSTVKPGDTVKVNFCVDNNAGFWGARLSYEFDEGLSLVDSGKTDTNTGEALTKYDTSKSFQSYICVSPVNDTNTLSIVYSNSNINYKTYYNGTIVSVYFKVDENADEGDYSIDFVSSDVIGSMTNGNSAASVKDNFNYYGTTITVSEDAQDEPVLGTPTLKGSIAGQADVKLTWTAAANAEAYEIYKVKSNYAAYERVAVVGGSTLIYHDTDVPEYASYNYMVKAVLGDKYNYSKSVSVSVSPYLVIGTQDFKPRLTWNAGSNATSYSVYRNAGGNSSSYTLIASGITTNYYVDNTAYSCISYKYQVRGYISSLITKNSSYTTWSAAKPHATDDWIMLQEPNFNQGGYRERYCTECGSLVDSEYLDQLYIDPWMIEGASIRLGTVNGIRFVTYIDSWLVENVKSYGYTVTMGTLIGPEDLIGEELDFDDLENGRAANVVSNDFYATDRIAGSIAKIKESNTGYSATSGNITRNFVGRGYAIAEKGDERIVVLAEYSSGNFDECSRSMKSVSLALQNDENQVSLYNTYKEKVDKWAAAER